MPIYTDTAFGLEGPRNVIKEIEEILVDQNVIQPYRTRNNVVDSPTQVTFWYLNLTDEFAIKMGLLDPGNTPIEATYGNSNQGITEPERHPKEKTLEQEKQDLAQQVAALEKDASNERNQGPMDSSKGEISEPVATEEA